VLALSPADPRRHIGFTLGFALMFAASACVLLRLQDAAR
jgi:hypothetical protein